MADRNYQFSSCCYTRCNVDKWLDQENQVQTPEYMAISRALARHESINGRMKEFGILREVFRCKKKLHIFVFNAIAVLTQIEKENGRPVFDAHNYADPIRI